MSDERDARKDRSRENQGRDRDLGLFQPITRRDLLHGAGVAAVGAATAPLSALAAPEAGPNSQAAPNPLAAPEAPDFAPERAPDYYPPTRTQLRGNHEGSFEVAHARAWQGKQWPDPTPVDETYDLVVVGGGMSGLAAAYFYRAAHKDARILVLDNHDDFGGHAKRNEFHHGSERYLSIGGSVYLEHTHYGDVTLGLLDQLGVDIERLREDQDEDFLHRPFGLESGVYFDSDLYETDRLLTGDLLPFTLTGSDGEYHWREQVSRIPISAKARTELKRFLTEHTDYMADVPDAKKAAALSKMPYHDFLMKHAGLPEEAASIYQRYLAVYAGVGTDATAADYCLQGGLPGLRGLGAYGRALEEKMSSGPSGTVGAYFPDGNATVPRLLVRALIPDVAPGKDMNDVAAARFDYSRLDTPGSKVRIRLSSTAVHVDPPAADDEGVSVTYVRGGRAYRVRARDCVLAGYHEMIPHLCPQLPEEQKAALRYGVKTPLVSTNVLLRNAKAFTGVGAAGFYSPGRFHTMAFAYGRSLGHHKQEWNPEKPISLHMIAAPGSEIDAGSMRERFKAGRHRLLAMTFTDYEREVREHLAGMLGGGGFDPSRDILAMTVNRWPHGYAYDRDPLHDPEWAEGEAPHEIGRRKFGRITIANSDAGAAAYLDCAVDQAHRAVQELVAEDVSS